LLERSRIIHAPNNLALGALWERIHSECPAFLDNAVTTRRDAAARAKVLLAFFGPACDVRSLGADDGGWRDTETLLHVYQ